jgi:hypothetical protein
MRQQILESLYRRRDQIKESLLNEALSPSGRESYGNPIYSDPETQEPLYKFPFNKPRVDPGEPEYGDTILPGGRGRRPFRGIPGLLRPDGRAPGRDGDPGSKQPGRGGGGRRGGGGGRGRGG